MTFKQYGKEPGVKHGDAWNLQYEKLRELHFGS